MIRLVGIFTICFVLTTASSFAEEAQKGATATVASATAGDQSSTPAAPSAAPATAAPLATDSAPAAPAPVAPPALKPITITFSGEVASVAAAENPPMITIQDRYGVKKEIAVPSEAKITAGTASKALSDLKAGDKVTVEYTYDVATGKRTAQIITVGEAAPAPATAAPAAGQ